MRGASVGFTVLLLGELVARVFLGFQIGLALYLVAALAYALAGNRAARGTPSVRDAARDGALAAVASYGLTMPLRVILHEGPSIRAAEVAIAFAAIVGALAAVIVARARRAGASVARR